jgi:hypothetical protein
MEMKKPLRSKYSILVNFKRSQLESMTNDNQTPENVIANLDWQSNCHVIE